MKKIISRILIIFIILILMFEFCFSSNVSYAMDISDEFINTLTSLAGGLVAYGIWFKRIIAVVISSVFNEILSVSFAGSCGVNWGNALGFATPYAIFFNKYKLFDVNLFDIGSGTGIINKIRTSTASWFYVMRNISAGILLCILIYVGIRMAISTVAEEKAKYKKMFFDWCCSLALIFVLQYIAIFTIYANNAIVNALKTLHIDGDLDEAIGTIALQALMPIGMESIVATVVYVMIVFQTISFMIAYMQRVLKVAFLLIISPLISITYSIDKMGDGKAQALNIWLKEFVYTILIQPFHCIIYMAFVNAATSLLVGDTSILSVLGTTISGLFSSGYNQLAKGMLVILCLVFVNDGEKAIRKIFNVIPDDNMTSMAAGAMVGMAVVSKAKNIGASTAKGINNARNFATALKGNRATDAKAFKDMFPNANAAAIGNKISNSKVGQGVSDFVNNHPIAQKAVQAGKWTGNKVSQAGKWAGDKVSKAGNKVTQGVQSYKDWSDNFHKKLAQDANDPSKNRLITGAKSWLAKGVPTTHNLKNSIPGALAIMGASMELATGTSGGKDALGTASAFNSGAETLFSSTLGTQSETLKEEDNNREEAELEQEKYSRNDAVRESAKKASADGKVPEAYNSDKKIDDVVDQYLKDESRLEMEKSQKGAINKQTLDNIAARRKQLENDGVLEAVQKRAELSTEKGKENFKKARREKNAKDGKAYSAKELESKANTLLQAIMELKLKRKYNEAETDSDMQFNLTDDEVSSATKTMDSLKKSIDRSFMQGSGGSFEMSRLLQQEMGLEDDGSEAYQSVMRAALAYREGIANNRAESVYENWGKLNGTRESLAKKAHNIDISEDDS